MNVLALGLAAAPVVAAGVLFRRHRRGWAAAAVVAAAALGVYGSGLISSHGECTRVLAGGCEIKDFNLDAVLNQQFQTSEMQPVLYAVESFDQIYEATKEAKERLG